MPLIKEKEIKKVIGLSKYGKIGDWTSRGIMWFSSLNKINNMYEDLKHLSGKDFINTLLKKFQLKYDLHKEDLKRIPKKGPFITISNHPLGAFDGVLLIKIMLKIRPDFKMIANFLLSRIEPIKNHFFSVNPFEYYNKSSLKGIKNAIKYIKKGHPIGMFPAGEVSSFQKKTGEISDREWQKTAIKFIIKVNVPIIPIYFHGRNSNFFYQFGRINEYFRTIMLPSEMFKQKGKIIKIRIGNPIKLNKLNKNSISYVKLFLRKKTYLLSNVYNKKRFINLYKKQFNLCKITNKNIKKIIKPIPYNDIQNEILNLYSTDLLFSNYKYEIFFTHASKIPNILIEIGRLREISFREVGQGTNKSLDIDKYDKYYYHLFLFHKIKKQIIGAYRMGFGKEIFNKYGVKGFYLNKFFFFKKEMYKFFINAIEMGRAFIIKDYQQKTLPLFLLWKGIIHLIKRYPTYKYLIGCVGISSQFSDFSISVMLEFMKLHYYDPFIAQYVFSRNAYKIKLNYSDKIFIFNESKNNLDKFEKLIDDIEYGNLKLPILIKKYIKQNARFISFNIDTNFNNSTDILMYIKISDIYKNNLKKY